MEVNGDKNNGAEYMLKMYNKTKSTNEYLAKSWLLVAQTIFSDNFDITLHGYYECLHVGNYKEAVIYLKKLLLNYSNKEEIQIVIKNLYEKIEGCNNDDVMKYVTKDVKELIYLQMAANSHNIIDYANIMVKTFYLFTDTLQSHGIEALNRLIECKADDNFKQIKDILVLKYIPLLLQQRLSFRKETLLILLKITLQYQFEKFYYNNLIMDNFHSIYKMVGDHLDWELSKLVESDEIEILDNFPKILIEIEKTYKKNLEIKAFAGNQEVFYALMTYFVYFFTRYLKAKIVLQAPPSEIRTSNDSKTKDIYDDFLSCILIPNWCSNKESGYCKLEDSNHLSCLKTKSEIAYFFPLNNYGIHSKDSLLCTDMLGESLNASGHCYNLIIADANFNQGFLEQFSEFNNSRLLKSFLIDFNLFHGRYANVLDLLLVEDNVVGVIPDSKITEKRALTENTEHWESFKLIAASIICLKTKNYNQCLESLFSLFEIIRLNNAFLKSTANGLQKLSNLKNENYSTFETAPPYFIVDCKPLSSYLYALSIYTYIIQKTVSKLHLLDQMNDTDLGFAEHNRKLVDIFVGQILIISQFLPCFSGLMETRNAVYPNQNSLLSYIERRCSNTDQHQHIRLKTRSDQAIVFSYICENLSAYLCDAGLIQELAFISAKYPFAFKITRDDDSCISHNQNSLDNLQRINESLFVEKMQNLPEEDNSEAAWIFKLNTALCYFLNELNFILKLFDLYKN